MCTDLTTLSIDIDPFATAHPLDGDQDVAVGQQAIHITALMARDQADDGVRLLPPNSTRITMPERSTTSAIGSETTRTGTGTNANDVAGSRYRTSTARMYGQRSKFDRVSWWAS
ncbi:MAG: hypothetical protein U0798_21410 [Gemmataceae bacterium]